MRVASPRFLNQRPSDSKRGTLSVAGRVMATITFDTLKFVEKLKAAGVPEGQAKAEAEALVSAFSEAMDSQLATKGDITHLETSIRTELNRLDRELLVVKWMVGLVLGGIFALILKAFFPT